MKSLQGVVGEIEPWLLLGAKTWRTRKTAPGKGSQPFPFSSHERFSVLLRESMSVLLGLCVSDADDGNL